MPNTPQTKSTNVPPKSKTRSRISKRQRNRRKNKLKLLNGNQNKSQSHQSSQIIFNQSAHTSGAEVWGEAYVNAVRWHGEHQNNFWRHAAEQLQNENQMLRQQLDYVANIKPETKLLYYETSDEDDRIAVKKEKEDEVDAEYLEFLQVTIKHREQLREKREAADLLQEESSTTGTVGVD